LIGARSVRTPLRMSASALDRQATGVAAAKGRRRIDRRLRWASRPWSIPPRCLRNRTIDHRGVIRDNDADPNSPAQVDELTVAGGPDRIQRLSSTSALSEATANVRSSVMPPTPAAAHRATRGGADIPNPSLRANLDAAVTNLDAKALRLEPFRFDFALSHQLFSGFRSESSGRRPTSLVGSSFSLLR
jgi:hypothetical protein